jgi:ubiquitin C-terminal hydrolase
MRQDARHCADRCCRHVQHCLKAFSELEALDPSEAYKCAGCKAVQPATKRLQVWRPPRCLVLTLKRFSQPSHSKLLPRYAEEAAAASKAFTRGCACSEPTPVCCTTSTAVHQVQTLP